ncbi:MAG: DALR domain-containing protein, partial [Thermodesulfobacteriota bacterium]|nr:DALR domain-containing protein [Thermodesulfobacteriota bacterium]
ALHTSRSALIRFYEMMDRVYSSPSNNPKPRLTDEINTLDTAFDSAMCDDFNTARAIAAIHEFTTAINRSLDKTPVITDKDKKALDASIAGITETLGILGQDPAAFLENARHASMDTTGPDPKEIQGLISERDQARKDREFKKADEIRDTLLSRGIVLRDTPEGTTWEKKRG